MKILFRSLTLYFLILQTALAALPQCEDFGNSDNDCYRSGNFFNSFISIVVLLILVSYLIYNLVFSKDARKGFLFFIVVMAVFFLSEYFAFQVAGNFGIIVTSIFWMFNRKFFDSGWKFFGLEGEKNKKQTENIPTYEEVKREIIPPSVSDDQTVIFTEKRKTSEEIRRDAFKQRYLAAQVHAKKQSERLKAEEREKENIAKISIPQIRKDDDEQREIHVEKSKQPTSEVKEQSTHKEYYSKSDVSAEKNKLIDTFKKEKLNLELVNSYHPVLKEYIALCKEFNALNLKSKFEAIEAFQDIQNFVSGAHGYVYSPRIFTEEQFTSIRKTIKNNESSKVKFMQLMREFYWSSLICLRYGDSGLVQIATDNYDLLSSIADGCTYEEFILDEEIQNLEIPEFFYSIKQRIEPQKYDSDYSEIFVCSYCYRGVYIRKRKPIDRCPYCAHPFNETLASNPQTSNDRERLNNLVVEASSQSSKIETKPNNSSTSYLKKINCPVCRYSLTVDTLDRETNCPNCRQYIAIT